jgi:hypothetical protein
MNTARILLTSMLLFMPLVTLAQSEGIAPSCPNVYPDGKDAGFFNDVRCACIESGDCTATDFFYVVKNASQDIFGIAAAAALLMFIAGGFMLIISGGNQTYVDRGREILKAAVIGLVIIFTAWIIINTIIVMLTGGDTTGTIFGDDWYKL